MAPTIDITIKTLDGNSRKFENVSNELTVKQLKEKIASRVNIPADRQRLIYAGRVLNDANLLSTYNLDGQAVHLVERQPVSNQPPQTSNSTRPQTPHSHSQNQRPFLPRGQVRFVYRNQPNASMRPGRPQFSNVFRHGVPGFPGFPMGGGVQIRSVRPPGHTGRPATTPVDAGSNRVEHCRKYIANVRHVLRHLKRLKLRINQPDENGQTDQQPANAGNSTTSADGANSEAEPSVAEQTDNAATDTSTQNNANGNNSRNLPRAFPAAEIIALHRATCDCEQELQEYVNLCESIISTSDVERPQPVQDLHTRLIHGIGEATHYLAHAQHSLSDLYTNLSHHPPLALAHPVPINAVTAIEMLVNTNGEPATDQNSANESASNNSPSQDATQTESNQSQNTTQFNTVSSGTTPQPIPVPGMPQGANFMPFPGISIPIFPPGVGPPNIQRFAGPVGPNTIVRAAFRTSAPIRMEATSAPPTQNVAMSAADVPERPNVSDNNAASTDNASDAQSNNNASGNGSQNSGTNSFQAFRNIPIPPGAFGPRDPFVPCNSRFFQRPVTVNATATSAGGNRNQTEQLSQNVGNTAVSGANGPQGNETSSDSQNEQNNGIMTDDFQNILQSMGLLGQVDLNLMTVNPERPIGEQIQEVLNNGLTGNGIQSDGELIYSNFHMEEPMDDAPYPEEHDFIPEAPQGANVLQSFMSNILQSGFGVMGAAGAMGNQQAGSVPNLYDLLQLGQPESTGLINDITAVFARSTSLPDMFSIMSGQPSRLSASRVPMRQFVQESILQGSTFSEDLLRERLRHLLSDDRSLELLNVQFRDNVDGRESVLRFFEQRTFDLCLLGLNEGLTDEEFAQNVYTFLNRLFFEVIVLYSQILHSSQQVETVLTNSLMSDFLTSRNRSSSNQQESNGQPHPFLGNLAGLEPMLSGLLQQQLTSLTSVASSRISSGEIEEFIVRRSSNVTRPERAEMDCSPAVDRPVSGDEVTDEGDHVQSTSAVKQQPVRPKVRPGLSSETRKRFSALIPDSSEPVSLFDSETVASCKEMFEEVLKGDEEKQRKETFPSYFSDAYLFGMPSRHRMNASSASLIGYDGSMQGILNRTLSNLTSSNVIDQQTGEDIRRTIRNDDELQDMFTDVLRTDFERRSERDPDMKDRSSTKRFCDRK